MASIKDHRSFVLESISYLYLQGPLKGWYAKVQWVYIVFITKCIFITWWQQNVDKYMDINIYLDPTT